MDVTRVFILKLLTFNATLATAETKSYKLTSATLPWCTYLNPFFLGVQERAELLSSSFAGKETASQEATAQQCKLQVPFSEVKTYFHEAKGSTPLKRKLAACSQPESTGQVSHL